MNTLEEILSLDTKVLQPKTGIKKMMCSKINKELEFHCTEIDTETLARIKEESVILTSDRQMRVNDFDANVRMIFKGCPSIFANQQVLKKFNCAEPQELIPRLLTEDEITELSDYVYSLSDRAVKETGKIDEKVGF